MFPFQREKGMFSLLGGGDVSMAGEKRVRFLVERQKCSFFQRDRGMFSLLERREDDSLWRGRNFPFFRESEECSPSVLERKEDDSL